MLRATAARQCQRPRRVEDRGRGTSERPQPFRNVLASPATRLRKPTPATLSGGASRAAGRSDRDRLRTRSPPPMATHRPDDAPDPGPDRPRQPVDRRAVRGRHPPRRGPHRGRRPARRPDRQAHRSLARGQVHRRRAGQPRQDLVGPGQPADHRGGLRPPAGPPGRLPAPTATCTAQDCFIGAAPAHRRSLRVYTETAWASIFARNLFRRPSPAQLRRLRARTSRSSASRRSRRTPRPRGPAPARRSSSTSSGWRSSSSAPSTPARSRRAPSRS